MVESGQAEDVLPDDGYKVRRGSCSTGCLALMLASVALLLLSTCDVKFDSDSWQRDSSRDNMAEDLVENHLRKGMTRSEIEKMLGPPDAGGDLECSSWKVWGLVILHVHYDEDGLVTRFEVIDHY